MQTSLIKPFAVATLLAAALLGCEGDKGDKGEQGPQGEPGVSETKPSSDGFTSLLIQTPVHAGDSVCFDGGVRITSGVDLDRDEMLSADEVDSTVHQCKAGSVNTTNNFKRIASFFVCSQIEAACNTDEETAAEIVTASADGLTLIYSNSPQNTIEFVDITNPAAPAPSGVLSLSGEPTSVATVGGYVLVGVNTSADFINTSGQLDVVDIASQTIVRSIDVGGQPDSVAISPDGTYVGVVIENERDEDLGDGVPPQAPAGTFVIVDMVGDVDAWSTRTVDLTGLAELYPGDPEPEYVDINEDNIAVVTLQENNHIMLIDLTSAEVVEHFSAGSVDLMGIDTEEEEPALISMSTNVDGILREPDGVTWINTMYFATADEGDLDGGSRGFTIFNTAGEVVFNSAAEMEHWAVRLGHYPDARSGNKGNEPENVEIGIFGNDRYLFVASERANLVFVYDIADPVAPILKQILPAGVGPEGVLAIPSRNLLIAASEKDGRDDKMRSLLNIYNYVHGSAVYPTLQSVDRVDATPIPWGALSGLSASPLQANYLYAVDDSFYQKNRILTIDVNSQPAQIVAEKTVKDSNGLLAALAAQSLADMNVEPDDVTRVGVFDEADQAALINADGTVNLDLEGVSAVADGFWVVSEGSGTIDDLTRPINSLNFLIKTDLEGVIENVVTLPESLNAMQLRFGFEGVAAADDKVYVAFQRAWGVDDNPRIGIYDTLNESWSFVFYPLDAVVSQDGGWVGLSDITWIEDERFLILERDNKGGPDAAIKRIYEIDLAGVNADSVVSKTLVSDLIPALSLSNGSLPEKVEGLALQSNGDIWIVNDNDGVDDNNGETLLMNLGDILR